MLTNEYTLITCPEILTMDEGNPTAEAVCISEGKILAVGTIAPGYYADFVQLSGNPLTVPPESIETLSVLKTISGGRIVYES